jgi:hypothetical protein
LGPAVSFALQLPDYCTRDDNQRHGSATPRTARGDVNPNFTARSAGISAASSSRPTMTEAAAPNLTRREAVLLADHSADTWTVAR